MTLTKNFPKIIYVISCPDGRQFRNAQFVAEESSINLKMKVTDQNVKTYTSSLSFSRRLRAPAPVSGTFPPARWSRARTSPRPPSARSSRRPASTWRSPRYSPSSQQVRIFKIVFHLARESFRDKSRARKWETQRGSDFKTSCAQYRALNSRHRG